MQLNFNPHDQKIKLLAHHPELVSHSNALEPKASNLEQHNTAFKNMKLTSLPTQ